jgi:hypothetical protein
MKALTLTEKIVVIKRLLMVQHCLIPDGAGLVMLVLVCQKLLYYVFWAVCITIVIINTGHPFIRSVESHFKNQSVTNANNCLLACVLM